MNDRISQTTGSVHTITDAYECIGVFDTRMPDGDVAAAFYAAYSAQRDKPNGNSFWPMKSLIMIAEERRSQLLAFVREMIPHLTKENVSILATKKAPAQNAESSTPAKVETTSDEPGFQFSKSSNFSIRASPQPFIFGASANSTPSKQGPVTTVDISDSDDSIASDQPDDASNFSSDFSSNSPPSPDDDSNVSETSEPAGGKFYNGEFWCCKVCNEELDDEGKCYDDHTTNPCRYCGKDFEPATCSRYCIECHAELPTPCSICYKHEASDEDEPRGDIQMVWDDRDEVWRCTTCNWEVEANSENEGQCHCTADPDVNNPSHLPPFFFTTSVVYMNNLKQTQEFIPTAELTNPRAFMRSPPHWSRPAVMKRLVRPIELLYYPEYEPADSDSSGEESVDEEPDSEDEWAIDDSEFEEPDELVVEGSLGEGSETVESATVQEGETPAASAVNADEAA
ncbi:MAG: hypothetical protein Q9195_005415 [Heterodermia aff. obscurata]